MCLRFERNRIQCPVTVKLCMHAVFTQKINRDCKKKKIQRKIAFLNFQFMLEASLEQNFLFLLG